MPPHPAETRAPALFATAFGGAPQALAAAPGRVNLIGEHTDYNDGFVLPIAIDRNTVSAGRLTSDGRVTMISAAVSEPVTLRLDEALEPHLPGVPHWTAYIRGVVSGFWRRGIRLPGLEIAIDSDVPLGGGLSSSASLEVSVATLVEALTEHRLSPRDKVQLCRQAEHEFAGVPCGIMDQTTAVLAREGHALLLDCRSQTVDHIPFSDPDVCMLVINTSVRHDLASGEYARRRAECAAAAEHLGVASLRDASIGALEAAAARLGATVARRARHVISENARTVSAADAMRASNWSRLGQLMYESHASLRDDFEVSCMELDTVVDIAHAIGEAGGVWGCRMTGGGFGGCAVGLVRQEAAEVVTARLATEYAALTGRTAIIFAVRPGGGAREI